MGVMIVVTIGIGLIQLVVSVPFLLVLRIKRALYRPPTLPPWASTADVDGRLVLRLASTIEGITPGTMGLVAVAQARHGDEEAGRALLSRAEARLAALSRIPFALRWDDGVLPELERTRLSDARQQFAAALLGQDRPPPPWVEPIALSWTREPVRFGGAPRPPDPLRVLVQEGQFDAARAWAGACPWDASAGEPAKAFAIVAVGQHEAGEVAGAAATLEEAVSVARRFSNVWPIGDDSGYRERTLASLAVLQVSIGDRIGAERTIGLIHDQDNADDACRDAAAILARRGDRRGALAILWQIADAEQKAQACLALADTCRSTDWADGPP